MEKKQRILNFVLVGISLFIIVEFLFGILNWHEHWWILMAWFAPLLGGIPYFVVTKRGEKS